jgi:hypothetical protein
MRVRARFALPALLRSIAIVACLAAVSPAAAGAEATVGRPAKASSVTGLPDGRVYEEVSPADKYGNSVLTFLGEGMGLARADGNAVMYIGDGALAEQSASGNDFAPFVSQRTATGWSTRSAQPLTAKGLKFPEENNGFIAAFPRFLLPSADLSHLAFMAYQYVAYAPPPDRYGMRDNLYLIGPDSLAEDAVWVARPQTPEALAEALAEADLPVGYGGAELLPVGGSPDLSTLYFSYSGKLLAEDGARVEGPGFYEYRNGALGEAGVLPDGSTSPSGAVPASSGNPDQLDNVVSVDGSRAFFLSVDPAAGAQELYVRETAQDGSRRTVLVSRSQLEGQTEKPAPHGPLSFANTAPGPNEFPTNDRYGSTGSNSSYVYAAPDGSHAFFESSDRLTDDAPEDESVKAYDFNVGTGSLEYLPGVVGSPVAAARDGSSLIFENTSTSPFELDRWSAGPNGGVVSRIAKLPAPGLLCAPVVCVGPARFSENGMVIVFETNSPVAGFNDGGWGQIFRYDGVSNELDCLSCPPPDVEPPGDAHMSIIDRDMNQDKSLATREAGPGDRGMSADGARVFFDSPAPLVPQDVNGKGDVYEWENGTVFLLSLGTSTEDSVFLDNSESGNDVFLSTASGIAQGDTDGGYDVYDARVPRPGDNPPPSAVPCQGDVCQGPPSVPQLLSPPASATFNGLGNLPPQSEAQPATVAKVKAKKQARRRKRKRSKRVGTSSRRFGIVSASKKGRGA